MSFDDEMEYATVHMNKMFWDKYRRVVQHIADKHGLHYNEVNVELKERITVFHQAAAGAQ